MNLDKRITDLEKQSGAEQEFILFIVTPLRCDPSKMGPERIVDRPVIGYRAIGQERAWYPVPGESIKELSARMETELKAEGRSAYAVCACYEVD